MNSVIIPRVFNGKKIFFEKQGSLIYLNATKTANEFNKRLDSWQKSPQTIEYVEALEKSFSEYTNSGNGAFIVVRKGGNDKNAQGTWLHPKLIIFFARWLSPDFAVWCDNIIEEILTTGSYSLPEKETSKKEKVEIELLGLKMATEILRVNEGSKILMMKKLYQKIGLETEYLPNYSEENHTFSLTHLLREFEVNLSAKRANEILLAKGILEIQTRKSSKSSELKEFKSLTENGLKFGKNLISPNNQLETQPHYFRETFTELLEILK
jgi:hypothetical protein